MLKVTPFQNNIKFGVANSVKEADRQKYINLAERLKTKVGSQDEFISTAKTKHKSLNEKEQTRLQQVYASIQEGLQSVLDGTLVNSAFDKAQTAHSNAVIEAELRLQNLRKNADAHVRTLVSGEISEHLSWMARMYSHETDYSFIDRQWDIWSRTFPRDGNKISGAEDIWYSTFPSDEPSA